jgi:GntR family transcriptional regulator/MocR family aminotransferase
MVWVKEPNRHPMDRPLHRRSLLEIGIERNDAEPLQSQIARQIRELVLNGRLRPRAKLPSTRALAEELGVARATVVEAYEQLAGEGYIDSRRGSGTQVTTELPEQLLKSPSSQAPAQTALRQPAMREPARPFRTGLVDWDNFPHDEWGKLLGRTWRNPSISLLEHSDVFGWLPLREAIARHLFEWRGISCEAARVIVTAGGSDAFDLMVRALFREGDQIWLEEPGYPTAQRVFRQGSLKAVPVIIDADGLKVEEGIRKAPNARAAFVTPARHYPTGVTMPLSRRLELLDWAREAKSIIIEDDYDSEYRYVGRPLPALSSLDHSSSVIYSGTFSKVFSPIARLGYIVVPQGMVDAFREARSNHGAPPSLLAQPALAEYLGSGAFAVHIRRMRRIYAQRRLKLIEALQQGDGQFYKLEASPAGLMVLLRLQDNDDDEALCRELLTHGIESQPLSSHYALKNKQQGLLLGFAGFGEKQLADSAARLLSILLRREKR